MELYSIYHRMFSGRADSRNYWELLRNYQRNMCVCGCVQSTSELLDEAGRVRGLGFGV